VEEFRLMTGQYSRPVRVVRAENFRDVRAQAGHRRVENRGVAGGCVERRMQIRLRRFDQDAQIDARRQQALMRDHASV
jgi:hypothetical protein